jgi:hypothetical protein
MSFETLSLLQGVNEGICLNYFLYFRAHQTPRNTSLMAPPEYRYAYFTSISFCRVACQILSERIELNTIQTDSKPATEFLQKTLKANGGADMMNQAHLSAMEYGRAYLIPSGGDREDGTPVIQVVQARDMVHAIDPYTGEVVEALRVYGHHREKRAYYTQDSTKYLISSGDGWVPDPNAPETPTVTGKCAVFPLMCRQDIGKPWGRPESKDAFKLQDAACRVATDMSIASATMATPQRVLSGVEPEDFQEKNPDGTPKLDADGNPVLTTGDQLYTSRLFTLSDPLAKIAEFTAAQLQNYSIALNSITRQAAAILGVPQSIFGVASDSNPASGDAMTQDDARLVRRAEQLTRGFEPGWRSLFDFILETNGFSDQSDSIVLRWYNPQLPNLASRAAAVFQLAAVVTDGKPLYDWDALHQLLGDDQVDVDAMRDRIEKTQIENALLGAAAPAPAERLLPARGKFDTLPPTPKEPPTGTANPAQSPNPASH